ncbi:uncharacterized protein IUM83_11500 [Phytophthora cinnamomi]|uniref:uncharacterized protein n=1 Tax=Phytophthora cinnamomi TaxID=4785 RepID=UPI00355A7FAE|nr:hypothetical protein IUM83_11500 [Phytophthora cinnamomi]
MTEVTRRLASCSDAAAVAAELRVALPDLASSQDRQAAVGDVVAFLTAVAERWTAATRTLISEISGDTSGCDVHLELLDALLAWAAQESVEVNPDILEILHQYFQVATRRLGDGGDTRRWLKWGDQVLAVVHKNAALMETQGALELRNKIEGGDGATPDLKTATFVWKVGLDTCSGSNNG